MMSGSPHADLTTIEFSRLVSGEDLSSCIEQVPLVVQTEELWFPLPKLSRDFHDTCTPACTRHHRLAGLRDGWIGCIDCVRYAFGVLISTAVFSSNLGMF